MHRSAVVRAPVGRPQRHGLIARLVVAGATVAATLAGAWTAPALAAPAAPSLTFATWNVCKITCDAPAPSWGVRRSRVARVINGSGADVVALNEATSQRHGSRTQWDDIRRLVSSGGFVAPDEQDDRCRLTGCTDGARLLFRSSTVRQLDFGRIASAGSWSLSSIAPGIRYDGGRQVSWAYLEGRDGTGPFLAVSVHLTNEKTPSGEQHRVEFGRAVTAWANAMNASRGLPGAPVVLLGDLNSFDARQPKGVQRVLREAGWRDAVEAPVRRNADINTVNYSDAGASGWPPRPIRSSTRTASRIDYVIFRGPVRAVSYEVVAYLNAHGTYTRSFQGSDHQMVRARLAFTGYEAPATSPADWPAAPAPAPVTPPTAPPADPLLDQYRYPAGPPFAERQIIAWVPERYDARQSAVYTRDVTVTARGDGTTAEVLLDGVWTPVPYRFWIDHDRLTATYTSRAIPGLTADPLGGVLPTRAWYER